MRIGIIGTRGIPNAYGGFEQFAEHFAVRMAKKGYDVSVYASHNHPYIATQYKNVKLISCYDPEYMLGTAGQFIYDFNCIRDSRNRNFDVILQLGYTSSTVWSWLYPKDAILVTNMDGLEWKREKYSKPVRYFLRYAEKWGVRFSDHLIADSKGIQEYLQDSYNAGSTYIPYGADLYEGNKDHHFALDAFSVRPYGYDLVIARFEPENNIEAILAAYASVPDRDLLLVGNHEATAFGKKMYKSYSSYEHIHFAGPVFEMAHLNALRYYARLYVHGHSVGGTNPSLLEAMACGSLICAHNNIFNKHVLDNDALYFNDKNDLKQIIAEPLSKERHAQWQYNNGQKILKEYNWERVTEKLASCFNEWKYGKRLQQAFYVS